MIQLQKSLKENGISEIWCQSVPYCPICNIYTIIITMHCDPNLSNFCKQRGLSKSLCVSLSHHHKHVLLNDMQRATCH